MFLRSIYQRSVKKESHQIVENQEKMKQLVPARQRTDKKYRHL